MSPLNIHVFGNIFLKLKLSNFQVNTMVQFQQGWIIILAPMFIVSTAKIFIQKQSEECEIKIAFLSEFIFYSLLNAERKKN